MSTIKETILGVGPGDPRAIPLEDISDVTGYRSEALRINNELRKKGVNTRDGTALHRIEEQPGGLPLHHQ